MQFSLHIQQTCKEKTDFFTYHQTFIKSILLVNHNRSGFADLGVITKAKVVTSTHYHLLKHRIRTRGALSL